MTGDDLENNSISDSKPVIEFKKRGNLTKPVQRKREYDIDEEEDINRAFKMKTDRANQKQTGQLEILDLIIDNRCNMS